MDPGRSSDANEFVTANENANSRHSDSSACKSDTDPALILRNVQDVSYIYRQDVVKNKANGKIGIVSEVAGDSDSDNSSSDDEDDDEDENDDEGEKHDKADFAEDGGIQSNGNADKNALESSDDNDDDGIPLTADHIRVLWLDDSESVEKTCDVTVIDRGFLHGDYVAAASDPAGQIGIVVDVDISVDLSRPDGSVMRDVPSRDLRRVRDFTVGDHVVLGPWLGRIEDVSDNVTVLFDDGSVCKVMKADPMQVKPVGKNILEDGHFPYYPGQRVKASSSSVFKNSRWLSGSWKAHRVEGTVIKVTVGSVYMYWIASAGYGPDSAITPSEEQSPKHLKLLSCFAHTNWQLGDWCLPPSTLGSVSILDKGLLKSELGNSDKDEPVHIDSDLEVSSTPESAADDKLIEDNLESPLDKNTEIREVPEGSSISCSSVSGLKQSSHDVRPLRKKIRKGLGRKDKKTRKKVENFVRALLIINTKTKVDVAWQDGTIERGLSSTSLISIDSPADHDFVAEQYVVEKAVDDNNDDVSIRHVGVLKSVDAKDRTACVRWLKPVARAEDPREFDKEEVVSVYELEGHPDYDYCYGDVVVRLSPVSLPPNMDGSPHCTEVSTLDSLAVNELSHNEGIHEGIKNMVTAFGDDMYKEFTDLSWVGNITGLANGDIEVTWADGMISMVGPQAIYVVGRDDDYSVAAGSYPSDDGASWETVDDDNVEAVDNEVEEHRTDSSMDASPETEDSSVAAENSESNGTLSAAFGFMTRIASGIFSRGQTQPGSLTSQCVSEDGIHHEQLTLEPNTLSSSPKTNDIGCQLSKLTIDGEEERDDALDGPHFIDITSNLSQLHSEDPHDVIMPKFRGFDIVSDPSDHHFLSGQGRNNTGRKWLKKVHQDWDILQRNLPEGIYVRVYEDRMDLLRAVIVGAYGTPYQDGLFFFDFHLPPEYPDVPPTAYYHSGGWRVNPNLYEDGKVCLSLLNTWTGRGNEVWDPSTSSILQVLVSLQGLVLNAKPYFNEAGYDKQVGTAEGEKNSLSYNENTFLLNCKTMMHLIRKPPKDFRGLVVTHFCKRGYYILKACDAYMKGQLIGTLREDASISTDDNANSNSIGFKLMLTKIVPRLYTALEEVGADCKEFKHLITLS